MRRKPATATNLPVMKGNNRVASRRTAYYDLKARL
jgi:hypothetical protein